MPLQIPYLNVFLSSPSDVAEERAIARKIMKRLPNRPMFRGRVALNIIAWDDLDSTTAMEASLHPQAAINKGLPTPAESDIVIVIFWSRMGTPFTDEDGAEYQSGTHWELLNALSSNSTKTYIYRRMIAPTIAMDDPKRTEKTEQYDKVQNFFNSELFYKDGQIQMSVNHYETPTSFEEMLDLNFEQMIKEVLEVIENSDNSVVNSKTVDTDQPQIQLAVTERWNPARSPFPGLRAFTEDDADIFFGRGRETDALVQQVKNSRFVAVVGASGSGKSSLVGAGLIPRLRENAIIGSKDWHIVRSTPGNRVFESLAKALIKQLPELNLMDLMQSPDNVLSQINDVLANQAEHIQVLLFIDQFEELFTLNTPDDMKSFTQLLSDIANSERIRVIATMRHDFYYRAVENPHLAELLRHGSFPLSIPKRDALRQMIERPAERAGIEFDSDLIDRILDDTGDEPGNLALMAYALDELYKLDDDNYLNHSEYEELGGVQGAIGTRAENQFTKLNLDESVIPQIFHELIEVDERGTITRRREKFQMDQLPENVYAFIDAFVNARLMISDFDEQTLTATVEVAHEAILSRWERLANWIEFAKVYQLIINRMRREALIWHYLGRPSHLLPNPEVLVEFRNACDKLSITLTDQILKDFIEPTQNQNRLYLNLEDDNTTHQERRDIGLKLNLIGDTRKGVGVRNGLPDIQWLDVKGSEGIYVFRDHIEKPYAKIQVSNFYISKYPITFSQYQCFIDTDYYAPHWWHSFPPEYAPTQITNQYIAGQFHPRDNVSWYQCVAYTRWLDKELRYMNQLPDSKLQVRLPTEWEWQWVAMNGADESEYPWGEWDSRFANTQEAGLGMSTAVGMYPHGASQTGAVGLSGNVREWCLYKCDDLELPIEERIKLGEGALRGGAFAHDKDSARTSQPAHLPLDRKDYANGFRVVLAHVIEW